MFNTTCLLEEDIKMQVLGISGSVLLVLIIVAVLMGIRSEVSQMPINYLVIMDCLLRLTKIPNILFVSKVFNLSTSPLSCSLRTTFSFTPSLGPRLLSITIALYRWTCVYRSTSVLTSAHRRTFFFRLSSTFTVLSLGLAAEAFYFKEDYIWYHICRGEKNVKADITWNLPLSNPFLLLTLGSFLGNLIICPLLYSVIFHFRRSNGQNIGLNAQTIKTRRRRNAVSGMLNFLVWLSESLILVISFGGRQTEGVYLVLYLVFDSCFTPVLY